MGLRSFIKSTLRVLKITRKPTRTSFRLSLRMCFIATVILGLIGFSIQFIASILQMLRPPTLPREITLYILIAFIVVILAILAYRRRIRRI